MVHSFDVAMILFEKENYKNEKLNIIRDICGLIDKAIAENNNLEFVAEIDNNNPVLNIIVPHDDDITIYDKWNIGLVSNAKSIDMFLTDENNICIKITI